MGRQKYVCNVSERIDAIKRLFIPSEELTGFQICLLILSACHLKWDTKILGCTNKATFANE